MSRRPPLPLIAGAAAFVLAVAVGLMIAGGGSSRHDAPADAAALQRIAEKNDDAATLAAARMRAESRRSSEAADALAENRAPATLPEPAPAR